jgi:hypothetical protein
MRVFTLTSTNDKEWFSFVDVFTEVLPALNAWNAEMLNHESDPVTLKEGKKALKEDGLFFTFVDGFGRKWASTLNSQETKR